jgi:hypothetical protein
MRLVGTASLSELIVMGVAFFSVASIMPRVINVRVSSLKSPRIRLLWSRIHLGTTSFSISSTSLSHVLPTFRGNVPALSKQKFSSNVIEKCIRKADFPMRRLFIKEMLSGHELEKMLRDSFANYVVQTAIDFADPESRTTLMDAIRPILPAIRQTPHGRRIAGKMVSLDAQSRASDGTLLQPNGHAVDDNAGYQTAHGLPVAQFAPRFNFPEHVVTQLATIAVNTEPANSESSSAGAADDATTVIYSPIPQHGNHAINGLNGVTSPSFPLF